MSDNLREVSPLSFFCLTFFHRGKPRGSDAPQVAGVELPLQPFLRMTYHTAMELYGSDKPDLRYDLRFHGEDGLFSSSCLLSGSFSSFDAKHHVTNLEATRSCIVLAFITLLLSI